VQWRSSGRVCALESEGQRFAPTCVQLLSLAPPENSGGAENSTEKSGPDAKHFFGSMYEMSQRHPVWVAENHVKPCNSVYFSEEFSSVDSQRVEIEYPQFSKLVAEITVAFIETI
jgi:hypothetical protein